MSQGVNCLFLWGKQQIKRSTVGLSARIVFGISWVQRWIRLQHFCGEATNMGITFWYASTSLSSKLYNCIWSNVSFKKKMQGFFGMHPWNLRTCKIMSFKAGISSSRRNFRGRPDPIPPGIWCHRDRCSTYKGVWDASDMYAKIWYKSPP